MKKTIVAGLCAASLIAVMGLAACTNSGGSSSASAAASSASASAASASASAASASAAASSASAEASSASATSASSTAQSASAEAPSASASAAAPDDKTPATNADGKQLASGTVVTTTVKDRAADLGIKASDFANDDSLLTLLVLDKPIEVVSYKGGSEYKGEATVLRLPNDEMFRQFKDKTITIGVDKWGERPADIMGALYDIVLGFDTDGLVLIEP